MKLHFDFKQLQIFCKVAELKSFSRAAEALFLTQPTVSSHIASLEKQIGAKLFDRLRGRNVSLTKAGEILYRHASEILRQKEAAAQEISEFLGALSGEMWVGASTIPGQYILPQQIAFFKQTHPHTNICLKIAGSSEIVQQVLGGTFELGVVGYKPKEKELHCKKLWSDEIVLVTPPDHPWRRRKEVSIEELKGQMFAFREPGSGTRKAFEQFLRKHGIEPLRDFNIICELGSTEAIKQFVAAGGAMSVLSHLAVQQEANHRRLIVLRIKEERIIRDFYCIRPTFRTPSPLCKAFEKFLEEQAK